MADKVKTWIWIVAAVVIVGILGLIAAAGAGMYFFSRHVETATASPARAERDFSEIEARFAGQKPLIELDAHGRFLRSNVDRPSRAGIDPPDVLRVMAFDPREGRTVRVSLPFWLLRMKSNAAIDFNGRRVRLEDLELSVADLERYGPALVVDHRASSGQRVVVWTERK